MIEYYICVRRFVLSDPELPDSLYTTIFNVKLTNSYFIEYLTLGPIDLFSKS